MDLPLKALCYLFLAFFGVILLAGSPPGTLSVIISSGMVTSLGPGF